MNWIWRAYSIAYAMDSNSAFHREVWLSSNSWSLGTCWTPTVRVLESVLGILVVFRKMLQKFIIGFELCFKIVAALVFYWFASVSTNFYRHLSTVLSTKLLDVFHHGVESSAFFYQQNVIFKKQTYLGKCKWMGVFTKLRFCFSL